MQKQLTKIPSALAKLNLPAIVEISEPILPEEGAAILVEALSDADKNNLIVGAGDLLSAWDAQEILCISME